MHQQPFEMQRATSELQDAGNRVANRNEIPDKSSSISSKYELGRWLRWSYEGCNERKIPPLLRLSSSEGLGRIELIHSVWVKSKRELSVTPTRIVRASKQL